jgi:hypothetical protein
MGGDRRRTPQHLRSFMQRRYQPPLTVHRSTEKNARQEQRTGCGSPLALLLNSALWSRTKMEVTDELFVHLSRAPYRKIAFSFKGAASSLHVAAETLASWD